MPLVKDHIPKAKFSFEDLFDKKVEIYSKSIDCTKLKYPNYKLILRTTELYYLRLKCVQ